MAMISFEEYLESLGIQHNPPPTRDVRITRRRLPKRVYGIDSQWSRHDRYQILQAWGIRLGEEDESNPQFMMVGLPDSWRFEEYGANAFWNLIDENSRLRAVVTNPLSNQYESNGSAYVTLTTRYRIRDDERHTLGRRDVPAYYYALDGEEIIYTSKGYTDDEGGYPAARAEVIQWLHAHRPGWQDPLNYWR
jgi:hypothetical protein